MHNSLCNEKILYIYFVVKMIQQQIDNVIKKQKGVADELVQSIQRQLDPTNSKRDANCCDDLDGEVKPVTVSRVLEGT